MRQLGDVQIRMRLKVSGDKAEIRQHYLPALFPHVVKPLVDRGTVSDSFVVSVRAVHKFKKIGCCWGCY